MIRSEPRKSPHAPSALNLVLGSTVTQGAEVGFALVSVEPGDSRVEWVSLLELADEPVPLRGYLDEGALFGVRDERTRRPAAAVLVIDVDEKAAELRAVAVAEGEQGRGLGTWIVRQVCELLREVGTTRVIVGTASSGTRQLAFYQRLGFRITHVDHDWFSPERGYAEDARENGIPVRDMVWMAQDL